MCAYVHHNVYIGKHKHYYCNNCISKSNCIKSTCEPDRKDMQLKCREEYCAQWILVLMALDKPAYYSNDMSEMQLFCFGEMELSMYVYATQLICCENL